MDNAPRSFAALIPAELLKAALGNTEADRDCHPAPEVELANSQILLAVAIEISDRGLKKEAEQAHADIR